jgi:hypothetical protein
LILWDKDEYSVMRDRKEYHLFRSGTFLGTYPSMIEAQRRAEEDQGIRKAMTEVEESRARLRQVAAEKMKSKTK